jgi:excisionase family DNA binding protein
MTTVNFSEKSRLVRVTEVARQLSLSRSGVYGLMDRGALPYVKIGKARRVPIEAVERLVQENTITAGK